MKIILASKSPRRRKILKELGLSFSVKTFETDETLSRKYSPGVTVKKLAEKKLFAAVNELKRPQNTLLISADTIVYLNGRILGKPKDDSDAFNMLSDMSGTKHQVYSGIAAFYNGKYVSAFEKTDIEFRNISDEEINNYISSGEHMDKAGSYGIQEKGGYFVKKINGDLNNVVGLPVLLLRDTILEAFNIDIFDVKEKIY